MARGPDHDKSSLKKGSAMNLMETINNEQMAKLSAGRPIPAFAPGDLLRVSVKVVEGERERTQVFEGLCIGRSNAGLHSSFTVRKISYGEGVERVFPVNSPNIDKVEVERESEVMRSRLYYLRGRTGKAAVSVKEREFRTPVATPAVVAS